MAQRPESEEHREWREEQALRVDRFERVQSVAERLMIENPELPPKECVKLARELGSELRSLFPYPEREPAYSTEPEVPEGWPARLPGELPPSADTTPDEPALRTMTGFSFAPSPPEQGRVGGFWPSGAKSA